MPALRLPRLSSLRAFGHSSYVAMWLGSLVSNIGTWMETLALGVYVTETTGRAEWTGGIVALTFLPTAVLAPVGGALADRFDRRRYLAVGAVVQMLLACALALLAFTGTLSVSAVSVIALLNGCTSALMNPAFTALLAELVPPEDLHSALSLNSAQFNLGRIVGPALAATVLALWGPSWAFACNALSFGAVVVALSRVSPPPRARVTETESLGEGILRGLSVARGDPGISFSLTHTLSVSVLVAPFIGLVPVFALRVLGEGAAAASMLVTFQGLGAVTGVLAIGPLVDRFGRRRLLEASIALIGPVAMAYWLSPTLGLAAALMFPLGSLYFSTMTGLNLVCQSRVPRDLQARMSSLYNTTTGVGYALGVWGLGALADRFGVRPVTAGACALSIAIVLALRLWRPAGFESTDEARVAVPPPAAPH
ncbi:MFS transporter [Myxococcaceae bacterium GXIMD 01537]